MLAMDYSTKHRSCPGSPVRICVACDESVPSRQRNPYGMNPGSALAPIVVFCTMPGSEYRSLQGYWDVAAEDSRSSELPNSAGGLAIEIAGCRQQAEPHPLRGDDFKDTSVGSDHLSVAAVGCIVHGPITYDPIQAPQADHQGPHPRNWFDARRLRDCSLERVTSAGLGQRCLGPARARRVIRGPLKCHSLRVSLRRTPQKRHPVCGSSATPERDLHPPNQGN